MKRIWADSLVVVAITIAVLLPVAVYANLNHRVIVNAKVAYVTSCEDTNRVRTQFLGFVDSTVQRSERALAATLASPSSTAAVKLAAQTNLAGVKAFDAEAHRKAPQQSCVYPPTGQSGQ